MALRELTAPDGTAWQAYDVPPSTTPDLVHEGMEGGWLVFESDTHKCRINPAPDGWDVLTDEELLTLMRTANPVPKTTLKEPAA